MSNEKILMDKFKMTGNDYESFKKAIARMDEITKVEDIKKKDILPLSLCDLAEKQKDDSYIFYVMGRAHLDNVLLKGENFTYGAIKKDKLDKNLFEEMRNTTQYMWNIEGKNFFFSDLASPTFASRVSDTGENMLNKVNLFRNLKWSDDLTSSNECMRVVYREHEGQRKIMGCLSSAFAPVKQQILCDVIDAINDEKILGAPNVRYWSVDHEYTDIYMEFPEAAEEIQSTYGLKDAIVPGIFLCTSDIGRSSIIARSTYRMRKSGYVIMSEVTRKHSGDIKKEELLDMINEGIFSTVRVLPEKLADLMGKEVIDYANIDLSTEEGREKNIAEVGKVNDKIIKKIFTKVIGFSKMKSLQTLLKEEFNGEIRYTLYDLAVDIMMMPDRIEGLERDGLIKLRKACARAPFEVEKCISKTSSNDEELVLLPS